MTRKFDWNRTTYANVVAIFERLLTFLAEKLCDDYEGVYQSLRDMMDPNQAFYTKYCALQVC
jgi:hypothetical protein